MRNVFTVFALLAAIGFAFGAVASAETIVLVTDCNPPEVAEGDHEDDTLVDWLEGLGYTVDRAGMSMQMQGDLDAADLAAINASDLVIVSRRTNSGAYNKPTQWNGLEKPLILMSGYLTRNTRWGWTNGGSADVTRDATDMAVLDAGHYAFNQVHSLTGPITLFDWSPFTQSPKGVYIPLASDAVNGALVGTMGVDPDPVRAMMIDLPKGTDLGNFGVLGEQRILFAQWGYDQDLGDPVNRRATWSDFLTDDYKNVLENIIVHKIPEPASVTLLLMGLGCLVLVVARRR